MKGVAVGGLFIIALIVVAIALFLGLGQEKPQDNIIVISNATYNYANTTTNNTINETIVINNTYYIGSGSVTIPFENVTTGTGTGQYIIKQSDSGTFPFAIYRYDINRPYFKITNTGKIQWFQDGTNTASFEYDPIGFYNSFYSGVAVYGSDQTTPLIDFKSDDGTGSNDPQQIIVYANITYDHTVLTDQICETNKGTLYNYSRCFLLNGTMEERIGVFPV